jgi:aerobic-type carbon monoxide dehydrogenase small subunit (CoxS/CutS family)
VTKRTNRDAAPPSPPCGERVAGPPDRLGEGWRRVASPDRQEAPPLTPPHKGEGNGAIRLVLNGRPVSASVDPFATLASVLRDTLGLTGTKIGCDAGDCGACTVLMEGAQVCACLVPAAQAEGAVIHTVEGPGPEGVTDRLREAFLVHGAAQCGICTPGMLMAAADCLARDPAPSRDAVEDALGGVLCRCTGYVKIVEAVLAVAGHPPPPCGEGPGEGEGRDLGSFLPPTPALPRLKSDVSDFSSWLPNSGTPELGRGGSGRTAPPR